MSNYDYHPSHEELLASEAAAGKNPTPPKQGAGHLDSDQYWHTSDRHDGRGADWETASTATLAAECEAVRVSLEGTRAA